MLRVYFIYWKDVLCVFYIFVINVTTIFNACNWIQSNLKYNVIKANFSCAYGLCPAKWRKFFKYEEKWNVFIRKMTSYLTIFRHFHLLGEIKRWRGTIVFWTALSFGGWRRYYCQARVQFYSGYFPVPDNPHLNVHMDIWRTGGLGSGLGLTL